MKKEKKTINFENTWQIWTGQPKILKHVKKCSRKPRESLFSDGVCDGWHQRYAFFLCLWFASTHEWVGEAGPSLGVFQAWSVETGFPGLQRRASEAQHRDGREEREQTVRASEGWQGRPGDQRQAAAFTAAQKVMELARSGFTEDGEGDGSFVYKPFYFCAVFPSCSKLILPEKLDFASPSPPLFKFK